MSILVTEQTQPQPRPSINDVRAMLAAPTLMMGLMVLAGAPLGLLWAKVSPHVDLQRLLNRPEHELGHQVTVDLWFLLITALAGIVIGVLAGYLLWLRNARIVPYAYGALLAGGYLSATVAVAVGERSREFTKIPALLVQASPDTRTYVLDLLRFSLRASQETLVLPIAAVIAFTLMVAVTTVPTRSG